MTAHGMHLQGTEALARHFGALALAATRRLSYPRFDALPPALLTSIATCDACVFNHSGVTLCPDHGATFAVTYGYRDNGQ